MGIRKDQRGLYRVKQLKDIKKKEKEIARKIKQKRHKEKEQIYWMNRRMMLQEKRRRLEKEKMKSKEKRRINKKKAVAMAEVILAHDVSTKNRGSALGHPKKLKKVRHAIIQAPPRLSSASSSSTTRTNSVVRRYKHHKKMIEKKAEEVARASAAEQEKEQLRHLLVSQSVAREKSSEAKEKIAIMKAQVDQENRRGRGSGSKKPLTPPEILVIESSSSGDANAIAQNVEQEIRLAGVERRKKAIGRYIAKRQGIHHRYKSLAKKEARKKRKHHHAPKHHEKPEPKAAAAIARYRKKRPKIHVRQLEQLHEEQLERKNKNERKKRKERLLAGSSSSSSSSSSGHYPDLSGSSTGLKKWKFNVIED